MRSAYLYFIYAVVFVFERKPRSTPANTSLADTYCDSQLSNGPLEKFAQTVAPYFPLDIFVRSSVGILNANKYSCRVLNAHYKNIFVQSISI